MKRKAVFLFCSLIAKQEFFRQAQNNKSMGPRTHQQVKSATMHLPFFLHKLNIYQIQCQKNKIKKKKLVFIFHCKQKWVFSTELKRQWNENQNPLKIMGFFLWPTKPKAKILIWFSWFFLTKAKNQNTPSLAKPEEGKKESKNPFADRGRDGPVIKACNWK